VLNVTDLAGHSHLLVECLPLDIDTHFNLVREYVEEDTVDEYKARMLQAINAGSAYKLSDDSCFLYYRNYKPCCAEATSFYGKGSPLKMIALFDGVFSVIDTVTFKLAVQPHVNSNIDEYLSVLTVDSIKKYVTSNRYVVIRIDALRKRLSRLHNV